MKNIVIVALFCLMFTSKYIADEFVCPGCCAIGIDNEQRICNCPTICECSSNTTCTCPPDCGCNIYGCVGK